MRDPYEVLGMKDDSSSDEIKQRYDILLRRYKAYKTDPEKTPLDFDMDEVNAAYDNIMGYDIKAEDPNAGRKRTFLRILGIDPSKFDTFWLYNKVKIFAFIGVFLLLLSLVFTIINNKPKDFYIKIIGRFYISDEAKLVVQDAVNGDLVAVERSLVDSGFTGEDANAVYDVALLQKFVAEVAAKEVDIVICDWDKFDMYLKQGLFMDLSGLVPLAVLDKNKKYYYDGLVSETIAAKGYFGIEVSDIGFFSEIFNFDETRELILCIVVNTKRIDSVKSFLDRYIIK